MKILSIALIPILVAGIAAADEKYIGDFLWLTPDPSDFYMLNSYTAVPYERVTLYLVLDAPSAGSVTGWRAEVIVEGPALGAQWELAAGEDQDPADGIFDIVLPPEADPLYPDLLGQVVLATWSALIPFPADWVELRIRPGPEPACDAPCYDSGDLHGIHLASRFLDHGFTADAYINGWPQPNESTSWSAVKDLFR